MKAIELLNDFKDQRFKEVGGRVIWETIGVGKNGYSIVISRITETGGRPFMLGLRYKRKYIKPDAELEIIGGCPICGWDTCTSDHK